MSRGPDDVPPRRSRRRLRIASEDLSLWERIAGTVEPLRQAKPRVPEVEAERIERQPAPAAATSTAKPRPQPLRRDPKAPPPHPAKPHAAPPHRSPATPGPHLPHAAKAPALPALERRKARRIAAGTIDIEARLDLHGLTQSHAHVRLIGFIEASAAVGLKTVLVITGKGLGKSLSQSFPWGRDGEPGVLRQSVPRWLAEPRLAALVIGCQTAAPKHGGEGAIYVMLRRRGRG